MIQRIEDYLLGKLNQKEVDLLWIEFLKYPKWFEVFEIELMIRRLILVSGGYVSPGSLTSN